LDALAGFKFVLLRGQPDFIPDQRNEKRDVDLLRRKWSDVFNFGSHSGTRKRDYACVRNIMLNLSF
jgi:hypothetical protein